MLFEVAILSKPTKKEIEDGKSEELLWGIEKIVAKSEQAAVVKAMLKFQTDSGQPQDFDKIDLKIRSFN